MTGYVEVDEAASKTYEPRGAARELFFARDPELLIVGSAGTGKSRAALEKIHLCLQKYAGARALVCRKTRESMSQTTLVTFEEKVVQAGFFGDGPERSHRQSYNYRNGSELVCGGLDKPSKLYSSEYDLVLVEEATEIAENDWETLLSRLRNGVIPYQQAIAGCNPDAPSHWLNQRANKGQMKRLTSRHTDNPAVTPQYLAMLDRLTGVRRLRLRDGIWAATEGRIYEEFEGLAGHIIKWDCAVDDFSRMVAAVDWGWVHAGIIQVWGVDGDGRMFLVREVYHTQKTIEWWTQQAKLLREKLNVSQFVCDPARPDHMAQFEQAGLPVLPAFKSVLVGINNVKARLRKQEDGKARLFLLDDALGHAPDPSLIEQKRPWCTAHEFDSYVWATNGKDEPQKDDDHGMDAMRYAAAYIDNLNGGGVVIV